MKKFFILILLVFKVYAFENYLPDAVAFKSSLEFNKPNQAQLVFDIAAGYDIYSDKITITQLPNSSTKIGKIILPPPLTMKNDIVGDYSVYQHLVYIPIPITQIGSGELHLQVNFQGCKGLSYCYPGMSRILSAKYNNIPSHDNQQSTQSSAFTYHNNQLPYIQKSSSQQNMSFHPRLESIAATSSKPHNTGLFSNIFNHNSTSLQDSLISHPLLTIIGFFILGLLIAFTPCVFPMFPILLSIVAGKGDKDAFLLSLSYIIGGSCIYAIAGIVFSYIGINLQNYFQNIWMAIFMSLLLVIFSISLFGLFEIKLPHAVTSKLNQYTQSSSGSFISVFLIGAISTLILSPCVTAPLAGALLYISTTHNIILGGTALFTFGLGIGGPLLFIALLGNHYLPKSGTWMIRIKEFLGFIMLALAIYAVHAFINNYILSILIGLWFIALAIFLYRSLKIFKLLISVIIIITACLIIAYPYFHKQTSPTYSHIFTTTVNNIEDLNTVLSNTHKQLIILDFSASWCIACKEMDLTTWSDPQLLKLMQNTTNIRIDISSNDKSSKELEAKYQVFAPPAVIILDKHGNIIKSFMGNTPAISIINTLQK